MFSAESASFFIVNILFKDIFVTFRAFIKAIAITTIVAFLKIFLISKLSLTIFPSTPSKYLLNTIT